MAPRKPLNTKEITDLLSKLKDKTPDYPSDMLAAKKAAFLKQAVNIKIETKGQGGEGGSGGSGSSGSAFGGAATPGTLLQALIGIGLVAAISLAAYAYRDQIDDILQRNDGRAREELSQPSIVSTEPAPGTVTAVPSFIASAFDAPPVEIVPTGTPGGGDNIDLNGAAVVAGTPGAEIASEKTKTNSGLHLGQTPGTPAAPGQGNPGNVNKPDKTKPEKPDKPEKPEKPPKKEK
jgi:hypothetical protein